VIVPADQVVRSAQDPLTKQMRYVLEALALETSAMGATNAQIAAITDINPGQVSKTLSRLMKLGFVNRDPNADSKDGALYLIAQAGQNALESNA
jgi:DNA-binding IclR family transcriptional regulator